MKYSAQIHREEEAAKYAIGVEKDPDSRNDSNYMPHLSGCVATGDTIEGVKRLEFHLEGMREDGERISNPTTNLLIQCECRRQSWLDIDLSPVMGWSNFRYGACRKYPPSPGRPGRFSRGWPVKP